MQNSRRPEEREVQTQILTPLANMIFKETHHYYAQDCKSPEKLTCAFLSGNMRRVCKWDKKDLLDHKDAGLTVGAALYEGSPFLTLLHLLLILMEVVSLHMPTGICFEIKLWRHY